MFSFLQVSPPKPCIRLCSPPHVLHAPPIPFSILSLEQYCVKSTITYPKFPWNGKNFKSSHDVSFSDFVLILFSSSKYIFNASLRILSTTQRRRYVCVWNEQLKRSKAALRVEKGVPVPLRSPLISICTGTILNQGQKCDNAVDYQSEARYGLQTLSLPLSPDKTSSCCQYNVKLFNVFHVPDINKL